MIMLEIIHVVRVAIMSMLDKIIKDIVAIIGLIIMMMIHVVIMKKVIHMALAVQDVF